MVRVLQSFKSTIAFIKQFHLLNDLFSCFLREKLFHAFAQVPFCCIQLYTLLLICRWHWHHHQPRLQPQHWQHHVLLLHCSRAYSKYTFAVNKPMYGIVIQFLESNASRINSLDILFTLFFCSPSKIFMFICLLFV